MAKDAETRVRYLSVDQMLDRVERLRSERAAEEASRADFPDYVGQYESWAEAEASAARQLAQNTHHDSIPSATSDHLADENYVWVGDDMAVHLDAAEPFSEEEFAASDEEFEAPLTPSDEPWRSVPTSLIARLGLERYALGAAALGIVGLMIAGTIFRVAPPVRDLKNMASASDLVAGRAANEELSDNDTITTMVVIPDAGPVETSTRRHVRASEVEARVHRALDNTGFPDIGVSAGPHGDVYLAGDVYSLAEAKHIVRIARRAARAASVFFLHPDVRDPQGPAYFGAYAQYAPDVWGAKITSVAIGSPAYKAGLRTGDIVRGFDHKTIASAAELNEAVAQHRPGERIEIRVWRDGGNAFAVARLTVPPSTQIAMR